ncbi:MAG: hypothetical protein KJ737_00525 [Proteobacteria bacterium]|nr:hypothetical protein [Pseudomonadota bacterium]
MAQLNVNLSGHDVQEGFEIRPPGWYPARVSDSSITHNEGKDQCIVFEFELEDGKPGKVWEYLSLAPTPTKNNSTVRDISLSKLKTIATCCRHKNPNYIADTEELHGLKCMVRLKIEKDESGQYEPKNKISAYKSMDGNGPVQQPSQAPDTPPSEQKKPLMPWEAAG